MRQILDDKNNQNWQVSKTALKIAKIIVCFLKGKIREK